MADTPGPTIDEVKEFGVLLRAHHPLIAIETVEDQRVTNLLQYVADSMSLPYLEWTAHAGLVTVVSTTAIHNTEEPLGCLRHLEEHNREQVVHLRGFDSYLEDPRVVSAIKSLYALLSQHRGALVFSLANAQLPATLGPLFTFVELPAPDLHAYHRFVASLLRDLKQRMPVSVTLSQADVTQLLQNLQGLNFFEVRKLITQAVVEDGVLGQADLARTLDAKQKLIARSGVLDYFPADESWASVAGLERLKGWLQQRGTAFQDPKRAQAYGLDAPRGILLLGVQGCGKSASAKAVAGEWGLPLIRLDPSSLYSKYYGESEKNLRRAIAAAEQLAPIVLWIDEIEKAFGSDDPTGGPSQRIFGSFLTWLSEKNSQVFVVATANDISKLPPELLRKGRFDELFFVDLPQENERATIFEVHLSKRGWDPATYDVPRLAKESAGFSGAEIEEVVVSGLYAALGQGIALNDDHLLDGIARCTPLSVTMAEKIAVLREWASSRTTPASNPTQSAP